MGFIQMDHKLFRTPEYIEFAKTRKQLVYYFLRSAIIRDSKNVKNSAHGANYIYRKYYLNGALVSRYSQENIAKYLFTSQSRVSTYITELEGDGFIRVMKRRLQNGVDICYYQFGTWSGECGTGSYKEEYWLDRFFLKKYDEYVENKKKNSAVDMYRYFINFYTDLDFDEFITQMSSMRELTVDDIELISQLWLECR